MVSRARGVAPGTYAKAWASIKDHTPGQLKEMEACARYLEQRGGRGGGKGESGGGWVCGGGVCVWVGGCVCGGGGASPCFVVKNRGWRVQELGV